MNIDIRQANYISHNYKSWTNLGERIFRYKDRVRSGLKSSLSLCFLLHDVYPLMCVPRAQIQSLWYLRFDERGTQHQLIELR